MVTACPRKVSDLALLRIDSSCKCIASELLSMEVPRFGWALREFGARFCLGCFGTDRTHVSQQRELLQKQLCNGHCKNIFLSFLHPR